MPVILLIMSDQHQGGVAGYGRMIRRGCWKLISYAGYPKDDLLFHLEDDPGELTKVRERHRTHYRGRSAGKRI